MALENLKVHAQTPFMARGTLGTANTNDDGTGTITQIAQLGAKGGLITALRVLPAATVAATRVVIWTSSDGATWRKWLEGVLGAWTKAVGTVGDPLALIDPAAAVDESRALPGSTYVGITIQVANAVDYSMEWAEFADRAP